MGSSIFSLTLSIFFPSRRHVCLVLSHKDFRWDGGWWPWWVPDNQQNGDNACLAPVVLRPFHQASSAQLQPHPFSGSSPKPHGRSWRSYYPQAKRPLIAQSTPATGIVRRASCGRRPGRPSRRTESQLREASLITHTHNPTLPPAPQDCKSLDRSGRVWLRNRPAVREGLPLKRTDATSQCAAWGPQCEAAWP